MTLPARRFTNDEDAGRYWLELLRSGSDSEQIEAREHLAAIFEQRGMYDEAADLLVANVRAGVRNTEIFLGLSRIYRALGDEELATRAAAEAARILAAEAPPPSVPQPHAATAPIAVQPPVESPAAHPQPANTQVASTQPAVSRSASPPSSVRTAALLGVSVLLLPPLAIALVWIRPWRQSLKIALTVPLGIWMLIYFGVAAGGGYVRPLMSARQEQAVAQPERLIQAAVLEPTLQATAIPSTPTVVVPIATATPPPPEPTRQPAVSSPSPAPIAAPPRPPERVAVRGAGAEGASLRAEPSQNSERVKILRDGQVLEIAGQDQEAGGRRWRNVRDTGDGATGWIAADFVAAPGTVAAASAAKPTTSATEVQAYLGWLAPIVKLAGESIQTVASQSEQVSRNPSLISNQEWRQKTSQGIGFLRSAGESLQAYPGTVPSDARRLDGIVKEMGRDLVEMSREYAAGIDSVSTQQIQKAVSRMSTFGPKVQAASAEIQRLQSQ